MATGQLSHVVLAQGSGSYSGGRCEHSHVLIAVWWDHVWERTASTLPVGSRGKQPAMCVLVQGRRRYKRKQVLFTSTSRERGRMEAYWRKLKREPGYLVDLRVWCGYASE